MMLRDAQFYAWLFNVPLEQVALGGLCSTLVLLVQSTLGYSPSQSFIPTGFGGKPDLHLATEVLPHIFRAAGLHTSGEVSPGVIRQQDCFCRV